MKKRAKLWTPERVKELLRTDPNWRDRALTALLRNNLVSKTRINSFGKTDYEVLSDLWEWRFTEKRNWKPEQDKTLKRLLPVYATRLAKLANGR